MSHDHTHEISAEQLLLESLQQHVDMLRLSDRIQRKALLQLLPNVGDSVDVELDTTREDEMLANDEGTAYLAKVTIVRTEGDTFDLMM